MRRFSLSVAVVALSVFLLPVTASAEDFTEALARAYTTSPDLEAAQAELRATDEQAALARSGARPSLTATASAGVTRQDNSALPNDNYTSNAAQLQVSQPLFRGGRTLASIRQADSAIEAGRAALLSSEQKVLLSGAEAYLTVIRDEAVLKLNRNNEEVLERQLQATQDRFSVGDVTRTDVSQAEARKSRATAARVQAEGALTASRAAYQRVFGVMPEANLTPPKVQLALPASLDDTIAEAEKNNPELVAAKKSRDYADAALDNVKGERLPTIAAVGTMSQSHDLGGSNYDRQDTASAMLRMEWSLYDGGATSSRIRAAKQEVARRASLAGSADRGVVEAATQSWEQLQTATASRVSREAQVKAAQIALDGVREEERVGSRTVLDTLDAEQELLDARVALVTSQHDEILSRYQLLSAVGRLTARELKLPVEYYDEKAYAEKVRHKAIGSGVGEAKKAAPDKAKQK